jgi:hypothetical protein
MSLLQGLLRLSITCILTVTLEAVRYYAKLRLLLLRYFQLVSIHTIYFFACSAALQCHPG